MKFNETEIDINGEVFHLKELSVRQRREMLEMNKNNTDPIEVQARALQMGCVELASVDIEAIYDMPGRIFGKLADELMKVSGLIEDDEVKNS